MRIIATFAVGLGLTFASIGCDPPQEGAPAPEQNAEQPAAPGLEDQQPGIPGEQDHPTIPAPNDAPSGEAP